MLTDYRPPKISTYTFHFKKSHEVAQVNSIGWEKIVSTAYYWDGLKRPERDRYLLQYTLDGFGEFQSNGKITRMTPGKAFLVSLPDEHVYYFPKKSESWEFIYTILSGHEVKRIWDELHEEHGKIIELDSDSSLIQCLLDIYHQARKNQINDNYHNSYLAYQVIMELKRWSLDLDSEKKQYPLSVEMALHFIHSYYDKALTLDDIAEASGLSKHHFGRVFQQYIHETPAKYLIKKRIEKAVELLTNTQLTNAEIAERIGFSNANYFCKVFRELIGTSPKNFRNGDDLVPARHIFFD